MAENTIKAYNFDLAFVGASGIDLEHGTTTFNELTQVTNTIAEVSQQVVVMAESAKVSRKMPNQELAWHQVSVFISDDTLADNNKTTIEQHGVKVICASVKQ